MQDKEYRNIKKRAFYLTVFTNIIFFISLFIIIAWTETYPPPKEYGIELGTEVLDNSLLEDDNIENTDEENIDDIESTNEDNDEKITESTEKEVFEDVIEKESSEINNIENELEEEILIPETESNISNENISESNTSSYDSSDFTSSSKEEKIDERALYNSESSTGKEGSSLEMQGWAWDFAPNPNDKSSESGKIVFELIVDYYGDIIGLKTIETTLSPKVENIYREEILKLTFSPTNNNNPADISKGKITFIIKNK